MLDLLNQPYEYLTQDQIELFKKNRFIKLKNVFSSILIEYFNEAISKVVDKLNTQKTPLENRDTYGKAFLQIFNLWRESEAVKPFCFSKRLAKIASDLMEVNGVRMYHDQALFKEANGGITPWHADQYYWPLESDKTITAWIPLQATPLEMGPLEFSAGSHQIAEGRDMAISDESEAFMDKKLHISNFKTFVEPFDVGEVSFHSGWVFHRAGANQTNMTRKVMTIIYIDKNMRLKKPENNGQQNDWETWCPGASVGSVINTPLNPIIYP
tara:strand:+ start:147 stop:953 length:807 start_codon:yes stop_codon:yes gene_type:complete